MAKSCMILGNFSNRDIITIKFNKFGKSGLILSSIYMAHENSAHEIDSEVYNKLIELNKFTQKHKIPMLLTTDCNGHHSLWNSKDTNTRGRLVAELITQNKLNIENKGAVATFLNTRGFNSIIDLTLTNDLSTTMISNWKVSDLVSLSDHKLITFQLNVGNIHVTYEQDFRNIDYSKFNKIIEDELSNKPFKKCLAPTQKNLDKCMKYISDILQIAIEETCKMKKVIHKSKIPWSKELDILKKEARSTRCRTSREEAEKNYRSAIRNVE